MKCPKCGSEMNPIYGHWYLEKFYCPKCGHEEKVKP
jgi:DNA-directed RNA polymerase subunit M/transcription elongation factor TFIIS